MKATLNRRHHVSNIRVHAIRAKLIEEASKQRISNLQKIVSMAS